MRGAFFEHFPAVFRLRQGRKAGNRRKSPSGAVRHTGTGRQCVAYADVRSDFDSDTNFTPTPEADADLRADAVSGISQAGIRGRKGDDGFL